MASKTVFATKGMSVKVTDSENEAGGRSYAFGEEHALAQGIVTSTFNRTYYRSEQDQLDQILDLSRKCDPEFVAKAAVYAREVAKMKDSPALMLAVLFARGENELARKIAPRILSNFKMVRNFVQMVRSGRTGRKCFGSTGARNSVRKWFASRGGNALFRGSLGNDPSMADVIKLIHPGPESDEKRALYGYFLGKEHDAGALPPVVRQFEAFKRHLLEGGDEVPVPRVDFRMLAGLPLKPSHWSQIIMEMPWFALRMNLNTAARHGAFDDKEVVSAVVAKLADPGEVRRNNAFPYQLLTTFQSIDAKVPVAIGNALQDAMEVATEHVPAIDGGVAVCVDVSGSMQTVATGSRGGSASEKQGATSKTRCVDVAALVAASLLRKNPGAIIVPFDGRVHVDHRFNPRDSVMTTAEKLASFGGGATDCGAAMRHLNTILSDRPKVVIYVSDNESWANTNGDLGRYSRGTGVSHEWDTYRRKTRGARMINIDIQANATTQISDSGDVMNIGGFSDGVWETIDRFLKGDNTDFVGVIKGTIDLDGKVGSDNDEKGMIDEVEQSS